MMNFFLSIFLCIAMTFSGVAELPAEPESATTWTLRNVAVEVEGEEYALAPEARLTLAFGANRATAQFAVQSGEKTMLPMAAELSKDAMRLAFGSCERAYVLTDAELMRFAEEVSDVENPRELLDAVSDLFLSYGKMAGAQRDPEAARAYGEAALQALVDTCQTGAEPARVELDGAVLDGQKISLRLTPQNTVALFEALSESGIPGLNEYIQALLTLGNQAGDTNYQSISELFAAEYADADAEDFSLPLCVTVAEGDGVRYVKEEFDFAQEDGRAMAACSEVVTRDTHTEETLTMSLQSGDGTSARCDFSGTLMGPAAAYDGLYGELDFTMIEPDDGERRTSTLHVAVGADASDDPGSGNVSCEFTQSVDGATSGGDAFTRFNVDWAGRREDDESVTWAVEIAGGDEGAAKLRFELNRAEGAYESPFEGMEAFEIEPEWLDDMELSPDETQRALPDEIRRALGSDAFQLALDASALAAEPSVQALAELFAQSLAAPEPVDSDEEDYDLRDVETLEEAAGIFDGAIPSYAPPEGWTLTGIQVCPACFYLNYENGETEEMFEISGARSAEGEREDYVYSDGALVPREGAEVEVYSDKDGIYLAIVNLPEGEFGVRYYGDCTLDELALLVGGFH